MCIKIPQKNYLTIISFLDWTSIYEKIKIFCTLGPSSLNKEFLKFAQKAKIDLVRLNMSHLSIKKLINNIKFIQKNSKINICVDTEGAQIRTKIIKENT